MPRGSPQLRRLLHPAYRRLETYVHPLRYLFLEVTQRCNLACRHCGSDCGREPRLAELTTREWLDCIAYLGTHFDRRNLVLVMTGGEPLCHPELERLLEGISEQRLRFGMVTNGWALTDRRVDLLLRHGLCSITVSLDGLAAQHDWLRGRKGAFDRTLAGITRLVGAGVPRFDVVTCVHPGNLDELPATSALLRRLGVPAWRLFGIFPKGRAASDARLRLDDTGWRRLFAFIGREREAWSGSPFQVTFGCESYLPARIDHAIRDEPYFCRAGIAIGSVLCDGAITACPNITRDLVQGNVRTDDLATVWEERFQPFRNRSWMRQGECARCDQWKRCLGNSLHLWDPTAGHTAFCAYRALCGAGADSA